MADSDLTIVILRNIQAEIASFRENFVAIQDNFSSIQDNFAVLHQRIDSFRDQVMHQFSHIDNRLTNVEEITIKTATSLGIETQSSRHRAIRNEGEIAELKVRVSALETIVKGKPTL
jgi:predicted  nucleic acid-binding Zn-ribbon protein